jgi:dimethylargininase
MVFIVASVTILVNTLFARPVESLAGLGITALGVPVYYHWHRRGGASRRTEESPVALSTPRGFIKLRMGLEGRRGEEEWMAQILEALGEPCVGAIAAPGTVEGGDVILADTVAFVGISKRSNEAGVGQLSGMLWDMGYEVRTTPLDERWMHIGGPMSVIAPNRVLCCRGVFPEGFFDGFATVEVEPRGPSTGNVICLQANEVLANAAENAETIRALEERGVVVHGLDLSEFRKGAGGPTCLIMPVDRTPRFS